MSRSYTKGWMAGKGSGGKVFKKLSNRRFRQAGKVMLDEAPTNRDATFNTYEDRRDKFYVAGYLLGCEDENEINRCRKFFQK